MCVCLSSVSRRRALVVVGADAHAGARLLARGVLAALRVGGLLVEDGQRGRADERAELGELRRGRLERAPGQGEGKGEGEGEGWDEREGEGAGEGEGEGEGEG